MFKIEHIQRQDSGADKQRDGVSSTIRKVHQAKSSFLQQKKFCSDEKRQLVPRQLIHIM